MYYRKDIKIAKELVGIKLEKILAIKNCICNSKVRRRKSMGRFTKCTIARTITVCLSSILFSTIMMKWLLPTVRPIPSVISKMWFSIWRRITTALVRMFSCRDDNIITKILYFALRNRYSSPDYHWLCCKQRRKDLSCHHRQNTSWII